MKKTLLISIAFAFASCGEPSQKTETAVIQVKDTTANSTTNEDIKAVGTFCYLQTFNKDTTKVTLRISNGKVSGEMNWQPHEKDGAVGFLTGVTLPTGELDLLYDFTIEGSHQTETKRMKFSGDKLLIKQGQLTDPKNDGNLIYKNVAEATYSDTLTKTQCL